jgi:hypothetical protein
MGLEVNDTFGSLHPSFDVLYCTLDNMQRKSFVFFFFFFLWEGGFFKRHGKTEGTKKSETQMLAKFFYPCSNGPAMYGYCCSKGMGIFQGLWLHDTYTHLRRFSDGRERETGPGTMDYLR